MSPQFDAPKQKLGWPSMLAISIMAIMSISLYSYTLRASRQPDLMKGAGHPAVLKEMPNKYGYMWFPETGFSMLMPGPVQPVFGGIWPPAFSNYLESQSSYRAQGHSPDIGVNIDFWELNATRPMEKLAGWAYGRIAARFGAKLVNKREITDPKQPDTARLKVTMDTSSGRMYVDGLLLVHGNQVIFVNALYYANEATPRFPKATETMFQTARFVTAENARKLMAVGKSRG